MFNVLGSKRTAALYPDIDVEIDYSDKILNIGSNELNINKKDLLDIILKISPIEFEYKFLTNKNALYFFCLSAISNHAPSANAV